MHHTQKTLPTHTTFTQYTIILHMNKHYTYTLLTKTLCMYTQHTKYYIHTAHKNTTHATHRNLTHEYMLNTRILHTQHKKNTHTQHYLHKYYTKLWRSFMQIHACKHEDQSQNSRIFAGVMYCQCLGCAERDISTTCWTATLTNLMNSRLVRDFA